jgi:hypothetical protein
MQANLINLINPDDVENFLKKFSNGDPVVEKFLVVACANIIKKSPEYMAEIQTLPDDAPGWLAQKWDPDRTWHKFDPRKNIKLPGFVYSIAQWIEQALYYEVPWTKNLDKYGRPRKLLKISSFKQAFNELYADEDVIRNIKRARARDELKEEEQGMDFEKVMSFDDGHYIVKLISLRALDRESAYMEHCIGDGNYDERFQNKTLFFYSLRSADNTSILSFVTEPSSRYLCAVSGRRNAAPSFKDLQYIGSFCYQYYVEMSGAIFAENAHVLMDSDRKLYGVKEPDPTDLH